MRRLEIEELDRTKSLEPGTTSSRLANEVLEAAPASFGAEHDRQSTR